MKRSPNFFPETRDEFRTEATSSEGGRDIIHNIEFACQLFEIDSNNLMTEMAYGRGIMNLGEYKAISDAIEDHISAIDFITNALQGRRLLNQMSANIKKGKEIDASNVLELFSAQMNKYNPGKDEEKLSKFIIGLMKEMPDIKENLNKINSDTNIAEIKKLNEDFNDSYEILYNKIAEYLVSQLDKGRNLHNIP